jgi:hypothetical protein
MKCADGDLLLIDKRILFELAKDPSELWSDAELSSAVEAYVFMLRAERAGVTFSSGITAKLLLSGSLKDRNEAAVRYRMRNISAVALEIGGPALGAYTPAEQVGTKVRARIRSILLENESFKAVLEQTGPESSRQAGSPNSKEEALHRLSSLRVKISELERELVGIGHNKPPEPLYIGGPNRTTFAEAYEDIEALEEQVRKHDPDPGASKRHVDRLLGFGLKIALWTGDRVTKFVDASLTILAPVLVAKATGLAPVLFDAVSAVLRAIAG